MAAPTQWSVASKEGVDVTTYYANISASVSPETPAPPFAVGDMVHGNQGSEFIFVQASTSITLGDFVVVTNNFFANSMTTTNIASTLGADIAQVGAILAQSVTFIPAGAFFWAALRGHNLPGNANDAVVAGAPVQLFTSATAGIVTSTSGGVGLAGIEVISSVTPLFKLTWPRASVSNSLAAPLSNA